MPAKRNMALAKAEQVRPYAEGAALQRLCLIRRILIGNDTNTPALQGPRAIRQALVGPNSFGHGSTDRPVACRWRNPAFVGLVREALPEHRSGFIRGQGRSHRSRLTPQMLATANRDMAKRFTGMACSYRAGQCSPHLPERR